MNINKCTQTVLITLLNTVHTKNNDTSPQVSKKIVLKNGLRFLPCSRLSIIGAGKSKFEKGKGEAEASASC